GK
ncbi:hemolysin-type calcium-binding repeat family protein, partial [Vibrio cholerae HC-17A1]